MTHEDSIAMYITDACNRKSPSHGAKNIMQFINEHYIPRLMEECPWMSKTIDEIPNYRCMLPCHGSTIVYCPCNGKCGTGKKPSVSEEGILKIIFKHSDPITCDPESEAVIYHNKFGELAHSIMKYIKGER